MTIAAVRDLERATYTLTPSQFRRIADLLYAHAGLRMRAGTEGLMRARLARRLRAIGVADFDAYLAVVEGDPARREFVEMIDALTTNKTSFLREVQHFEYLRDHVLPSLHGPVRIWSAGCASGEEPYTVAMLLNDAYGDIARRDVRVLATDLSHRVLATAKAGVYPATAMSGVSAAWRTRYWMRRSNAAGDAEYVAGPPLTRVVTIAKLNLMDTWPMQGPFDAIFCRNVMIYFDKPTQQALIERFWSLLSPGGHLFVGHSESLTGHAHQFRFVQPAVYVK